MPIRKDATGRRWIEMEVVVAGTPEQVWHAMATGPGNTAWFTRSEIEPHIGGKLSFDFGAGVVAHGQVTAWQPPHLFGYIEPVWEPNAPPISTEITITPREGNQCVVRMAHTLFSQNDQWDMHVEGFETGWPGYFAILSIYLEHFADATAGSFVAIVPSKQSSESAWTRVCQLLDLTGANVGERRTTSSAFEPWSGIVERVFQDRTQRWVVLRLDKPTPGAVLVGAADVPDVDGSPGANVSICRYYYGDGASERAADGDSKWREWLAHNFGEAQEKN